MKIRVLSLNVRYCNGQDKSRDWSHRSKLVKELITSQRPDLIALQEVLPHQRRDLEEHFPEFHWTGLGRFQDFSDEQCPVAVTRRFEMLGSTNFWLSENPDQPGSVGWDACLPRLCTAAWIQCGDTRLVFASTHFDHLGSKARKMSAELICSILHEPNTLVAGDLNCSPDSQPLQTLGRCFEDAACSQETRQSTFHDFGRLSRGPVIDFILHKPAFDVESFQVLAETGPHYCSDHFPLVAGLVLQSGIDPRRL